MSQTMKKKQQIALGEGSSPAESATPGSAPPKASRGRPAGKGTPSKKTKAASAIRREFLYFLQWGNLWIGANIYGRSKRVELDNLLTR
jgi:hypothetical protein